MYYTGSANQPKRSQTHHDSNSTSRAGRSPLRGGSTTGTLLDSYSQQSQYSPTTAASSYPYGGTSDPQRILPSSAYHSHSRTHSQVKAETSTPPMPVASPYTPQNALQPPSAY
ncbi:hypothetical protein SERLA73DRAFT_179840, partial [Serpula lacrymans var. lacrymans S7.3]